MSLTYNSTEISNVVVSLIQDSELDAFHMGAIVSTGGTNYAAGSVITGVTTSTLSDVLVGGHPIASIEQIYETPSSVTLLAEKTTTLSSLSENAGATATAWSGGTVSVDLGATSAFPTDITINVLLEGFTPAAYNGIKTATFTTAGNFTFESEDFGTVTTEGKVSIITGTVAHDSFPHGVPISGYLSNVTPSKLIGEYIFYFDGGTFYAAFTEITSTITATPSGRIRVAKVGTVSVFPQGVTTRAFIKGMGDAAYNGTKNITGGTGFIYYAITPPTANANVSRTPSFANARLSQALVTATAHGQTIGSTTNLILSGIIPTKYNKTWLSSIVDANTFAIAPNQLIGDATTLGEVLGPDAVNLSNAVNSFFSQGIAFETGHRASVSIIELGSVSIADGIDLLSMQIANFPKMFHAYCVPPGWSTGDMVTLAETYNDYGVLPTFFIQCANYTASIKFNDLVRVIVAVDGNNKPSTEYESAILMFKFLAKDATEQSPLTQMLYMPVIGTPYEFSSQNDPLINSFAENNVNYFAKASEGGLTNTLLIGGCTKANDDHGTPIDISSLWANDYFNFYADQTLAARVMEGASNPAKRLNLNNTDGQYSINDLQATLQGFIDKCKKAKIIEDSVLIDGKLQKTVALAQPYFDWKRANNADYEAKSYTGLSANVSYRIGIAHVTTHLNVSFN